MSAKGRGADHNPPNRFDRQHLSTDGSEDPPFPEDEDRPLPTTWSYDDSQQILHPVEAEDLSFDYGLNPYRGCEHGCAYCYARIYHEFLGHSAGLDFETKLVVKRNAPALLEKTLARPSHKPGKISLSGVTDCYQPLERKLRITRGCLEVLARFRHPVAIITKNTLVTRDLDLLRELAAHQAVAVYLSITTLDPDLARILEPRAPSPRARLAAIRQLAEAGIPAGVSAAPVIPGLNDAEMPAILQAAAQHGATFAAWSVVRLPGAVAEVFSSWLDLHRPFAKEKILNRIRTLHAGNLNARSDQSRMRGHGEAAKLLSQLFHLSCRRHGLSPRPTQLSTSSFRRLLPHQEELF